MNLNNKPKYSLINGVFKGATVVGLSLAIATFTTIGLPEKIPYTQEDKINNITFSTELIEIMSTEKITFQNQELYNLIVSQVGEPLTKEKLSDITELTIEEQLSNNNLSDLKYLPNLLSLTIHNNDLNLEDIQYNQNLYYLELNSCTIKNTQSLPNTTEGLILDNCTCNDNRLITPYNCNTLILTGSSINNLTLKNPKSLEYLSIIGDTILDLNTIKDCTNLSELTLKLCSNISNPHILTQLPNLKTLKIDDYCPIWLNNEILKHLPLSEEDKIIYSSEINTLDTIASTLVANESLSEEDKIQRIVLYILEKLKYDMDIVEDPDNTINSVHDYNLEPIKNALNNEEVVCINYACLFKALANRLNLNNYQLFSTNHSWNIVYQDGEYKGYDLTNLDIGPIVQMADTKELCIIADTTTEELIEQGNSEYLYYYGFDKIDDIDHQSLYTPTDIENTIINIGYINEKSISKILEKQEQLDTIGTRSIYIGIYLTLLRIGIDIIKRKKDKNKALVRENNAE